ncbi:Alpha/beta hydrolase [Bordetella tumbae]
MPEDFGYIHKKERGGDAAPRLQETNLKRSLVAALAILAATGAGAARADLASGAGEYEFRNTDTGQPVHVYYFKPEGYSADTPVVVLLHGIKRNAQTYRDGWIDIARQRKLMVLAPLFTRETYPGANGYNLGNVFHAVSHPEITGKAKPAERNPPARWSFALPDAVFTDFARRESTAQAGYTLYGHGAGAQFAHRYALFRPKSLACRIIAANPGWYTYPDASADWPYGLRDVTGVDGQQVDAYLGAPLLLMLGDADVHQAGVMRKTDDAQAQGPNRKARGERFYAHAQQLAKQHGTAFTWQLQHVTEAGHSNDQMAAAAAARVAACPMR